MIRLHITAEGQTEQTFAKRILTPHLARFDIVVDARCVLTGKDKRSTKEYKRRINQLRESEERRSNMA